MHGVQPVNPPRIAGLLGVAFVLGSFICASSLEEAWAMGTANRARESAQHWADEIVWGLAKQSQASSTLPAEANAPADAARKDLVELRLARRPMLEAVTLTNAMMGALLAAFAAWAMRLHASARGWLVQTAAVSAAFAGVQIAVGSELLIRQMVALAPYMRAIGVPAEVTRMRSAWAIVAAIPGALKMAFLLYLIIVMRRPAVRNLYSTRA